MFDRKPKPAPLPVRLTAASRAGQYIVPKLPRRKP